MASRYYKVTKPVSDKRDDAKPRKCLNCTETFDSEWSGERICKTCRPNWTNRTDDPAEPYSVGGQSPHRRQR